MFNSRTNLLIIAFLIITCSLLALYSAGYSKPVYKHTYLTQFVWLILGILIMIPIIFSNIKQIYHYSIHAYFILIFLLIITLIFGKEIRNTRGWIAIGSVNFQFSEFAKISTILFLARYIDSHFREFHKLSDFFGPFAIVLFPVFLILLQPDLGSTLVYFPALFVMLLMADADIKFIFYLIIIGLIAFILPLFITYYNLTTDISKNIWIKFITDKSLITAIASITLFFIIFLKIIFKFYPRYSFLNTVSTLLLVLLIGLSFSYVIDHKLKTYQKKRLLVFIDPQIDPYRSGYNIIQSKIAIGSGKLAGKGYLHGSQTQLGFLPEQTTDFIISVIGEEFGWIGMTLIMLLYYLLIQRCLKIAYNARDVFASQVAIGLSTIFVFQIFINLGMTLGVMPVTGIPLPLLSYGGSSLITSLAALGVLFNIDSQRS